MELIGIAEQFDVSGKVVSAEPYGMGHINDTFLVTAGRRYILQRLNTSLFPEPDRLMENIRLVTEHVAKKLPHEKVLTLVPARKGGCLVYDGGSAYRMYDFIERTECFQTADAAHFARSGEVFGRFTAALDDFDASQLYDVLPKFHDTRKRFADFTAALDANASGRADTCRPEIDFVLAREKYCPVFMDMLESGEIPYRVTHNDTKLNNVLFDLDSDGGAVIDLDTVMKGAAGFDFGDSIRFGASTAAEDETDLDKVHFDIKLFTAYAEGYLKYMGGLLNGKEKETLAFSAILLTYECGMRFLADYIAGDVYFKTHRPAHNLDRARTQFKLIAEMEAQLPGMNAVVAAACNR